VFNIELNKDLISSGKNNTGLGKKKKEKHSKLQIYVGDEIKDYIKAWNAASDLSSARDSL